jgi:putative addiction module component (TIGR02574 family)
LASRAIGELLDRLTLELHQADDPEVEDAWRQDLRNRLAEIESGQAQGIPGEEVSARVRRIVGR